MTELLAFAVSFVICAAAGKIIIPILRKMKAGQQIREIGPKWHLTKQGTPTMGGLMFIISIGITSVLIGIPEIQKGNFGHLFVFGLAFFYGVIGYIDDYVKVKKKRNLGLTSIQKLVLQIVVAAAFLAALRYFGYWSSELYIPFIKVTFHINWIVYSIFAIFVIVGCVNAVNLTDGIDGLAAGVTMPVSLFFIAMSVLFKRADLGIVSAAVFGGLGAFLIYNFHPAKVFMGDTGSLFLGGMVAGLAFAFDIPVILIPVGIIYIAETLSVVLQVSFFKLTHGKRIFKMSPLHHHFEMCGWSEVKIFTVFVCVTVIGCAIAVLGVM